MAAGRGSSALTTACIASTWRPVALAPPCEQRAASLLELNHKRGVLGECHLLQSFEYPGAEMFHMGSALNRQKRRAGSAVNTATAYPNRRWMSFG